MSYKLIKNTPDASELGDIREGIAIADTKEELETYCKNEFNVNTGRPEIFSWDPYYTIEKSKLIVIK